MKKTIQKLWNSFCEVWKHNIKEEPRKQFIKKPVENKIVLSLKIRKYLLENYDFRYNILMDETEYKGKQSPNSEFKVVGHREQNTLCIDAQANRINC